MTIYTEKEETTVKTLNAGCNLIDCFCCFFNIISLILNLAVYI